MFQYEIFILFLEKSILNMKNSIKHLFIFLSIFGLNLSAQAASISVNVAQTVGANFLISKGMTGVSSASSLTLAYTATTVANGTTINDYYVFSVNGAKGFVMVSGDDIIIPILAFSNNSNFDINNMSSSTKDWIDGYKNQITAAVTNNVPAKAGTAALWSTLKSGADNTHHLITSTTAVAPLVQTTWDQDGGSGSYPYNYYCPNTSTTGGLSVTGCVATAMSQVMKFWNWPTVGSGYHTYFDTYSSSSAMGSNTWNNFNYGNTAFNWSSMPLTSSNASVATLMYAAGVSVNMSYSANESGSYVDFYETYGVNCAEYALQTYFHYKPSLRGVLRFGIGNGSLGTYYEGQDYEYYHGSLNMDSVSEAAWVTMLQNELSLGHPMLYEGQGTLGGHCWVLDGWETTGDMFHFNWGWSGASDGYYTVDNLAPPALGTGGGGGNFNYDQGVVMGIEPDSFPSNPGNIELLAHLNTASNNMSMGYGTPFTIATKIKNTGTSAFNGSFCVELFDSSTNMITIIDSLTGASVAAGDSTAVLTFTCTPWAITPEIFNGMRIAYEAAGTGVWTPVANNGTFINYSAVSVLNDTDVVLADSMHVGNHTIQAGTALTVSTTLYNQGSISGSTANFSGTLRAVLVNTGTGAIFTVQSHTGESVSYGGTRNVSFTNSDIAVPAGLYALEIQHQYNGSGNYYTSSSDFYLNPILITVTCAPNAGTISGASAVCAGSSVTLSDTASSGSGTWSLSNTSIASVSGGVVSTTASGIDTVKYSLTNGCGTATSVAVLDIEVLPTPAAISGLDTVCTGGTISVSDATTGGVWSTAGSGIISVGTSGIVTGISTGTDDVIYTVTNACGGAPVALSIFVSPTPFPTGGTISSTSSSVCLGGTIVLTDTAGGGSGVWSSTNTGIASVSGSGVVSGVAAGNDTVLYSVTNSCGTGSSSIVVSFQTVPSAGTISGPDTVCTTGAGITLTETVGGGIWNVTNGNASISGGTVTGLSTGTDSVLYIVSNSCGADTAITMITVSDCSTLVNNVTKQSDVITLYPNPAQDNITISSTGMINAVVISNITGQEIFSQNYNTKDVTVNLNQLSPGIYLVRINDTKVYKIVKQ